MKSEKTELAIVKKDIDTLIPYAANSRTHSEEQISQIAASIHEFGFTNPILLDGDNGVIAGHGRIMAAKKLGLKKVPCIALGHLTDAQKRAYVIADNKLALNSDWDMEFLSSELQGLMEDDYSLDVIGFSQEELGAMSLSVSEVDMPELSTEDPEFQQKTFIFHNDQVPSVEEAIALAKKAPLCDTGVNDNSNGNALSLICEEWLKQKT